jgi:hypothetical protein
MFNTGICKLNHVVMDPEVKLGNDDKISSAIPFSPD